MGKKEIKRNTLIVYIGTHDNKNFKYQVITTSSDDMETGQSLSFGRRVLTVPVGNGISCHTDDGQSFGSFSWATPDQNNFIQKHFGDQVAEWSADDRMNAERIKIEKAGKSKGDRHFDSVVAEIKKATKHMNTRERLSAINYISNQILIQK